MEDAGIERGAWNVKKPAHVLRSTFHSSHLYASVPHLWLTTHWVFLCVCSVFSVVNCLSKRPMNSKAPPRAPGNRTVAPKRTAAIPERFQLLVDCRDESEQRTLYEELAARQIRCRVWVI
jgi:cytochrome c biogenesis protein ResB